jgi:Protein of unknown function (DUF1553)/Protein of unknown function (DUF1549)
MSRGFGKRHRQHAARPTWMRTVLVCLVSPLAGGCFFGLRAEPPKSAANPADLASYDALIRPEDREHWAFQAVTAPTIPAVKNGMWARNPIDRFVLARQEEQGLAPAPAAEPAALVRRLYLDLTGLPPTPDECAAFLADFCRSPGAVESLIDNLLARPAYGERWARHWLDLVRYAESNAYERDATKPFAWRYRDYVIQSFNSDKPFDRFVLEQIAGDELAEADHTAENLIATGYYRLGPWDDEPADPKQDRYDQLDDIVTTTSEVFLGLTLGCARCHNHKFEPLSMHDYYRMVAVFEPLQRPAKGRTERTLPIGTRAQITGRAQKLDQGYFLHEPSPRPPKSHLLHRGQAANPGPEVGPGVPAVLVASQPPFPKPPEGATTSQRRLALARWLTDPNNPLTTRVIVNRVWQYHFGFGLVRTSSDFGTTGDPPTHPELLDWLARWFVDHGRSMKALHRLIVTSNTYQQSTIGSARGAKLDPENRLLWRMPYRRLEVEVIRDAMLAASGELNRQMYGPSMYPEVPAAALAGSSDPGKIWPPFHEASASRRTIYAFVKRSLIVPMFDVLDFCDTARSAARRNVTSVPTQALTLLNGDFVNRQARHLAARVEWEAGCDPAVQIERAYQLSLCRSPRESERSALLGFLDREGTARLAEAAVAGAPITAAQAHHEGLVQICRAIFNTNDFVYPD